MMRYRAFFARRPVTGRPFARSIGLICTARSGRFIEPDQADATCPVRCETSLLLKIRNNASLPTQITCISFAIPAHTKGRFAIVTDVGSGCDGREWRC